MNTSEIYGWDLPDRRGFNSFDDAILSMDDKPVDGTYWLVHYEVFKLRVIDEKEPLVWEYVCHWDNVLME